MHSCISIFYKIWKLYGDCKVSWCARCFSNRNHGIGNMFGILGLSQAFATRRHVNLIERWNKYEFECEMLIIVRWQAGWLLVVHVPVARLPQCSSLDAGASGFYNLWIKNIIMDSVMQKESDRCVMNKISLFLLCRDERRANYVAV